MNIREITESDLEGLMKLYTYLHGNEMPDDINALRKLWHAILADPTHHILIGTENETIISSCVVIIIPNLTHHQQPYAVIENVITHPDFRGKGYASALLNAARDLAIKENCYKIMLMTGSKKESTLNFYKRAGYNCDDKTAFIQWV